MTTYPDTSAGVRVTSDLLTGMLDNYVIKGADTTRASTTTVSSDPDLATGTLLAGGVYLVEFRIQFAGLQIAGLKTQWAFPASAAGFKDTMGPGSANATESNANTTEMRWAVHGFGTAVAYTNPRNSASLSTHAEERGIITLGATSGAVTLQWAQNTSNATGTIVNANSYVRYRQIG